MIGGVFALDIETLVMPGEVIAGHAKYETDCAACHQAFSREKQNSLCTDCHVEIASDQFSGKGYHGLDEGAGDQDCSSCHTEHIGRDANVVILDKDTFNHEVTDFALLGEHASVECGDCHVPEKKYREAPQACIDCHLEDDVHEGGLGENCASCHGPTDWITVEFDHVEETGFILDGSHELVVCSGCHIDQVFVDTPTECVDCHLDDDVHENRNGEVCSDCHGTANWEESFFDHTTQTNFPLFGEHLLTSCDACHVSTVKLESTCVSCHQTDDAHEGLLGDDCGSCHGESNWQTTTFRHNTNTDFPLLGSHQSLVCSDCHALPVAESNPGTSCYACHQEDDPHAGQLGEECGDCHNEVDWVEKVRFDHDFTIFPLIGSHREVLCVDCHSDSQFQDAASECVDCHLDEDVHEGGLGEDCAGCHSPVDWGLSRFDHLLASGFALLGKHAEVVCADCHREPPTKDGDLRSRCIDCHRNDDVHNGQLGKDCARCHSTSTFSGAREEP